MSEKSPKRGKSPKRSEEKTPTKEHRDSIFSAEAKGAAKPAGREKSPTRGFGVATKIDSAAIKKAF